MMPSNLHVIPENNKSGQWCLFCWYEAFSAALNHEHELQTDPHHNFFALEPPITQFHAFALLKLKPCSLWTSSIQQCDWLTSGPITSLISAPPPALIVVSAVNQCSRTGITWWVAVSNQRPPPLLDPPLLMLLTLSCHMGLFCCYTCAVLDQCVDIMSLLRTASLCVFIAGS